MFRSIIVAAGVLALTSGVAPAAEQPVPVTGLKAGIDTYRGKKIDVSGRLDILGEIATLGTETSGAPAVLVDLANLSRDQRQSLVGKCSMGCNVRIKGRGGLVLRNPGVIAIDIRPVEDVPSKIASTAN